MCIIPSTKCSAKLAAAASAANQNRAKRFFLLWYPSWFLNPPKWRIKCMHDQIYDNICQVIGKTPIVRLNRIAKNGWAEMLVKLESFNPGGGVKDRIGLSMIEAAEKEGKLKQG